MKVRVAAIHPSSSAQDLIRVKVLFEEKTQDEGRPLATEGAAIELYIEPTDSYAEIQQRAIDKAREFLAEAVTAGSES